MTSNAICPKPDDWGKVYASLMEHWKSMGCEGPKPPLPPLLSGWWYTLPITKAILWQQTCMWAEERGLAHLVRDVELLVKTPVLDAHYSNWRITPCVRPSKEVAADKLAMLKTRWEEIAGADMAQHSMPIKFTGRKLRRLLVLADLRYRPPWGSWSWISSQHRNVFHDFRRKVNDCVSPHEVDHICFTSTEGVSCECCGR
jgi:hypothetical protein